MKTKLLIVLLSFLYSLSYAQTTDRLEFDQRDNFQDETAIPLENQMLLVQSLGKKGIKGQNELKTEFYSSDFQLLKSVSIMIKERSAFKESYQNQDRNYSFYRTKRNSFTIVTSDSKSMTSQKVEGKFPKGAEFSGMRVSENKVVLCMTHKRAEKMIIINLTDGKYKEITFKINKIRTKNISIQDFQVLDNEILVYLKVNQDRKNSDVYIARIGFDGIQKQIFCVTQDTPEKIISVSATKIDGKYIITGTYSKNNNKMSQGIYIGEVENEKLHFIKFYNFADLKNFTQFMSEKEQKKIERKKEKAEQKGEELLLNYNIASHPIVSVSDGYEFLGEAYYPTYRTYTTSSFMNGHWSTQIHTVFDGFRYTHATLVKFDKDGNIIWDNTFKMFPWTKPMSVKKFITMKDAEGYVNLMYGNINQLNYKVVDSNNGNDVNIATKNIETGIENDKIRRSSSYPEYWYDNYFIVYGTQTISNSQVERKRNVFYVNKIKVTN